jgi:hypothetical protein
METKTAFDLNTAIQRWRDHLSQSPCFRRENLDELETHLRDAVAALRGTTLSEEEAFLVAARRLGGAPALEPEFAKVNGQEVWLNRLLWMLLGAQLWPLICCCANILADATVMGGLVGFGHPLKSPTGQFVLLPTVLVAATAAHLLALGSCVAAGWWVFRRKGRTVANTAASVLRRPLFVQILICAIIPCVLMGINVGRSAFIMRWLPAARHGGVYMSVSYGMWLSSAVVGPALAVVTILLARRQLRLRANS